MLKLLKTAVLGATLLFPNALMAQSQDSVFESYQAYQTFVDTQIAEANYGELVKVLGGRDEYTPEQLAQVVSQFQRALPHQMTDKATLRQIKLSDEFVQEAFAYWAADTLQYVYFYALVHQRENELVVLQFNLNTDAETILSEF